MVARQSNFNAEIEKDLAEDTELSQATAQFRKSQLYKKGPVKYYLKRVKFLHDYFLHRMKRCPFTGNFYLIGVDELYDFTYVDLFDRDRLLGTCEEVTNDALKKNLKNISGT